MPMRQLIHALERSNILLLHTPTFWQIQTQAPPLVGNNAGTISVYVANNLSSNFYCEFVQNGAGVISLVANGGVTLQARNGSNSAGNLAAFAIQTLASNVFLVVWC